MWPASIALVAAYIPGDIKRVLKHPMLVGVKIWAVAHLSPTAISAALLCLVRCWPGRCMTASRLSAAAIAGSPPIPIGGRRNDIVAIIVGTILYLALGCVFHPLVIGVPAFGSAWRWDADACRCMTDIRRLTAPDIGARKGAEPIVCLTSYHAHTARILDGYCDVILVGDSLGMVMHGLETPFRSHST